MPKPLQMDPGREARAHGTQLLIFWGPEEVNPVWVVKAVVLSSCVRRRPGSSPHPVATVGVLG